MKVLQNMFKSLRSKLVGLFIVLTLVPLLVVGIVSYQKSFQMLFEYNKATSSLLADVFLHELDTMLVDAERLLELENNQMVRRFLYAQTDTYQEAKEILKTLQLYRETYELDKWVLNISLVNLYGKGISDRKGVFQLNKNIKKDYYYQYLLNHPDETLYVPPTANPKVPPLDGTDYKGKDHISIISTIKQPITHQVIGFIAIDLDATTIQHLLNRTRIGETGYFFITDRRGVPIFWPENVSRQNELPVSIEIPSNQATKGQYVNHHEKTSKFVVYTTSAPTGWLVVGQVPMREINREADHIRLIIFSSGMISAFVSVSLYFYLTHRMIRPVQVLKNKMRKAASGYLGAKVKPVGNDEIADLGRSFNSMLEQIKQLLNRSIEEQKQIKMAELRTLQAQITPHFLYNTLDSIIWMAEKQRTDLVIRLVKALSGFYRISLSKGRDIITIAEEIEHIRNYLFIQQMRYRDILDYSIEIQPDILQQPLLKMSLQPIVENAIYHGIKQRRGQGKIEIIGWKDENNTIFLRVSDNGIGMTPERLSQVCAALHHWRERPKTDNTLGFGLSNVHQRIRLLYGEPYGVQIQSEYLQGTSVMLQLPGDER